MIQPNPADLSLQDAARLRRAFGSPERDASDVGRVAWTRGDAVVLSENGKDTVVAVPNRDGTPSHPSLSADGTRLATLRTDSDGGTRIEVTPAATGLLGGVQRLLSSSVIGTGARILAVDLSDDGDLLAFLTDDASLHVSPTMGSHRTLSVWMGMPEIDGVKQMGRDLEFLSDGRVAIETTTGAWFVTDFGSFSRAALRLVDPDGYAACVRETMARVPALSETQAQALVERFGRAAAAACPSPDGQVVLVQAPVSPGRVQNHLLEPCSGREATLGQSAPHPPEWLQSGRGVRIPDGPFACLDEIFPAWGRDLGQESLQQRQREAGGIVREDGFVIVGGVRIPRRG